MSDALQAANTKFVEAKAQYDSGAAREEKLKILATAFDSFVELKGNLEEGSKVEYFININYVAISD